MENVQGYAKAGIPLEGIWLDIPYMNKFKDFSVDTTAFPSLKEFTKSLHDAGQRLIVIVDAGISADDPDDKYYRAAQEKKALIQSALHPD